MKNNKEVNTQITDIDIETNNQKKTRNMIDLVTTVLVILASVFFVISIFVFAIKLKGNLELEAAPTGEMMLNEVLLYGIENANPYDIVESVADYNACDDKKQDESTDMAVALSEYIEASFFKNAYEYVGDDIAVSKYDEILNDARERLSVQSYTDYIDSNYAKK